MKDGHRRKIMKCKDNVCGHDNSPDYLVDKGKVLSVRNPWGLLIFFGKDVENRGWSPWCGFTGPLWIHVSQKQEDYRKIYCEARPYLKAAMDVIEAICQSGMGLPFSEVLRQSDYGPGKIIGVVDLVRCMKESDSPWADPAVKRHWLLKYPRILNVPFPATGKRGMWDPPEGLKAYITKVGLDRMVKAL
jgi:hypothetical protein